MEKALRKKFVILSVSVVAMVLFTIAAVLNIINYIQIDTKANTIINILSQNEGEFGEDFANEFMHPDRAKNRDFNLSVETPFSTRFFTIQIDNNGEVLKTNFKSIKAVSEESTLIYLEKALASNKNKGYIDNFKFAINDNDDGKLLVFVDCGGDLYMFQSILTSSVLVFLVALFAVFVLVSIFSKKAVSPIVQSYEKQKRFITDVTHELKTPLAIMKANTEVTELENGTSQWSESTHKQINRLNTLITSLVTLTKLDESDRDIIKTDFSISDAIIEVSDTFTNLALQSNKKLSLDIQKDVTYNGDENLIRNLFSILIENAIKYGTENRDINISLKTSKNKVIITTENYSDNLKTGKYDNWFERFYREDSARNSESNSFGIGLSIAKSIVKKHGGKINASSQDEKIILFKTELPF